MTPIGKNGSFILWGTVTRDAKLRQTNSGKNVAGFGMKYNRGHNEDGQMVNSYMEVSVWEDNAHFIGDADVGIAKGDYVLVCGQLVEGLRCSLHPQSPSSPRSATRLRLRKNWTMQTENFPSE